MPYCSSSSCGGVPGPSVALLSERHRNDPEQNAQVEKQGAVLDAPNVLLELLRLGKVVEPVDLRPAGPAGPDLLPSVLGVTGGIVGQEAPGPTGLMSRRRTFQSTSSFRTGRALPKCQPQRGQPG